MKLHRLLLPLLAALALPASAESLLKDMPTESSAGAASAESQANNPIANIKAFNIQNYYIGEFTGIEEDGYQLVFRYAQPVKVGDSSWLVRASLPFNFFPEPPSGDITAGMGDFNVFAAYLFKTNNPAISFAIGPQLTAPTATDSFLGSEKWSAGLANVFFDGRSKKFQYGYLLTWQGDFAGDSGRAGVNVGAFQPFAFYQLGGGWYLRAAPIWVYNFQNDSYSVPVGVGLGKVIKKGKTVYNLFVEPQFSAFDRGAFQPDWQIYFSCNLQFLN